jgi:hypothetical protein
MTGRETIVGDGHLGAPVTQIFEADRHQGFVVRGRRTRVV